MDTKSNFTLDFHNVTWRGDRQDIGLFRMFLRLLTLEHEKMIEKVSFSFAETRKKIGKALGSIIYWQIRQQRVGVPQTAYSKNYHWLLRKIWTNIKRMKVDNSPW